MAAQDYTSVVQQLYVSYFGRPADYYGLRDFSAALAALDTKGEYKTFAAVNAAVQADKANTSALNKLVNSFNNSTESTNLYGSGSTKVEIGSFVNKIYQNVLGRDADLEGFNFWVEAISSGTLTKANAAASITAAAMTNTSAQGLLDAKTVANKLAVATAFTTAIDTPAEITSYAGDAAAAAARSLLAGVNSSTSVTAYQANVESTLANLGSIATGQTFSVTTAVDALVGTSGNDVFNALNVDANGDAHSTLTSFDSIDGGAGKDTLNIYADATNNVSLGSNTTIKNIEVINVYSTVAGAAPAAALVDAANYTGVTALWQNADAAAAVTHLGSATTAGFRGTKAGGISVGVADAATTATVALDGVVEAQTVAVTAGAAGKLASVTLSGNVVDGSDAGTTVGATTLAVTVGKDVQTLTVNTAVKTTLTVADNGKAVTTIAAGASTGAITFTGDADVTSITTGSGNDVVTLASALTATVKAATLTTGAGNDVITVAATGVLGTDSAIVDTVTVDAGAGNDDITVTLANEVKFNVTGGAGNDTITLDTTAAPVKIGDVIDGGEGTDTIGLAGKSSYVADDYLVYTKVLKNFEAIEFTTAAAGFDASQVAGFKSFTFDDTGVITKVAADQTVTTAGATLTVAAAGYTAAGATGNASSTVYSTDTATGALKVEAVADTTVTAKASSIALTVTAGDADVAAILTGDVKTATVALANSDDGMASVSVTTAATAAGTGPYTSLGGMTSLTLTGNGSATVVNAASTKLVTVDASGLASVNLDGDASTGLTYTSGNASAETIKLGAGIDTVTLNASTYGGVGSAHTFDTVSGLNIVLAADSKSVDTAASDTLVINAGVALTAAKFTTTETDLDLALKAAAAANNADASHTAVVFAFGGDTYVMIDNGTDVGLIDATDTVVKLAGVTNVDAVVLAVAHA